MELYEIVWKYLIETEFRMCKELCLGWGFFYLLVRNSPTFNNEIFWFGCGPQWRKNLYRENVGF